MIPVIQNALKELRKNNIALSEFQFIHGIYKSFGEGGAIMATSSIFAKVRIDDPKQANEAVRYDKYFRYVGSNRRGRNATVSFRFFLSDQSGN